MFQKCPGHPWYHWYFNLPEKSQMWTGPGTKTFTLWSKSNGGTPQVILPSRNSLFRWTVGSHIFWFLPYIQPHRHPHMYIPPCIQDSQLHILPICSSFMCTHTSTHTFTCMHTHRNTHTSTHIHMHTHAYTYIHIHTHTHACAHTHTHTHTKSKAPLIHKVIMWFSVQCDSYVQTARIFSVLLHLNSALHSLTCKYTTRQHTLQQQQQSLSPHHNIHCSNSNSPCPRTTTYTAATATVPVPASQHTLQQQQQSLSPHHNIHCSNSPCPSYMYVPCLSQHPWKTTRQRTLWQQPVSLHHKTTYTAETFPVLIHT